MRQQIKFLGGDQWTNKRKTYINTLGLNCGDSGLKEIIYTDTVIVRIIPIVLEGPKTAEAATTPKEFEAPTSIQPKIWPKNAIWISIFQNIWLIPVRKLDVVQNRIPCPAHSCGHQGNGQANLWLAHLPLDVAALPSPIASGFDVFYCEWHGRLCAMNV